ncbi:class I SAM-dependent methyltransferase [Agitococcus lubricus]|uniref:O-methyltransferase involved in polyketide biosynthesis n=1 Tax=Agitococcus lubricus TaxID=1077255 RepID=A0A2T5IWP1_9GAMM|nr:class I SAM-dependent methyltransferase [Agitococcus lubricus]PTQ88371.1 O-methyltransferase involved in polyketide biosynthesis [Agitococcus lubricus]
MTDIDSSSISFTAYYTGEVWRQHGLSSDIFKTNTGKTLFYLGQPIEKIAKTVMGFSTQTTLLQRHHMIDYVVKKAIEEQGVSQIVEIACGMSPRGVRFRQQYPDLHYIEADLPAMLAHKQRLLTEHGLLNEHHRVASINILAEDSADALAVVFAKQLDPQRKTLVITEGLINYFDLATISIFWQNLAQALKKFPQAGYVTDLYPNFPWHPMTKLINGFVYGLSKATKSHVSLHFKNEQAIIEGFKELGFAKTNVHIPESYYGVLPIPTQRVASLVRVVENWV